MKRCDCGCEVWKKERKPEKDEATPAKESRETRQQKDAVEMKTGRR